MTTSDYLPIAKDLTSGTIGGCLGILAGQPLDRVKVLKQTASSATTSATLYAGKPLGTIGTLITLTQREGVLSLWRGVGSPLIGAAPLNALVFAGNGYMSRLLEDNRHHHTNSSSSPRSSWLISSSGRPYHDYFLAGAFGGWLQTIVACPVELIKCKMQIQLTTKQNNHPVLSSTINKPSSLPTSGFSMLRSIYRNGGMRGLLRGYGITALRDTPSYGVYFLTYEYIKDQLISHPPPANHPGHRSDRTTIAAMLLAGSCAGLISWFSCYPVDVIKSIIQTSDTLTARTVVRDIYMRSGWRGFFTGLSPTLFRSVPVNAITFVVYEHSQLLLNRWLPGTPAAASSAAATASLS